jgi:hypothetical protein
MGEVYEAEETDTGRRVALKVLARALEDASAVSRFLREGRLAASVSHPNSVYIFGSHEVEGTPSIAMELLWAAHCRSSWAGRDRCGPPRPSTRSSRSSRVWKRPKPKGCSTGT